MDALSALSVALCVIEFCSTSLQILRTRASDYKLSTYIKSILHLDCGKDQHALNIAEYDTCRENLRSYFAEKGVLVFKWQVPGSGYGSGWIHWVRCAWHRHGQHASDQHQFPKAASQRDTGHLHPYTISYSGASSGRSSEWFQYKNILILLFLATHPSFVSAAPPSVASEVSHQHVHHFLQTKIKDPFSSLTSSSAQYFFVWGSFTCAAGGLLAIQRSNPYLKYFGFIANGFLMTVCVTVGAEAMLDLFPWTVMGTLLISSLFYVLSCSISDSAGNNHSNMSGKCCEDSEDLYEVWVVKALEEVLEGQI